MTLHVRLRLAALFLPAVLVVSCSGTPAPEEALSTQLDAVDDPGAFSMSYRAGGTDVLDCVQPNRRFRIDVDSDRAMFVVHAVDPDRRVVERDDQRLRLHRDLFAPGLTTATWVVADLDELADPQATALRRALGPDLAEYVLGQDPPPSGSAIAEGVLPIARSTTLVEEQGSTSTYRLELDDAAYAAAASHPTDDENVSSPTIELTVDDVGVRRIVVTPGDAAEEAAGGWSIVFSPAVDPVAVPSDGPEVALADLDIGELRARPLAGCEVGDDPPPATP